MNILKKLNETHGNGENNKTSFGGWLRISREKRGLRHKFKNAWKKECIRKTGGN